MLNLKKLIPVTISLCMMVPVAASAETLPVSSKDTKAPYVEQIKQERETIKTNRATNQSLKDAIKDKTEKAKSIIKEDRANKTFKNVKDAVKAQQVIIKQDRDNLKSINESLKTAWDKVKTDKTNKDYASLVTDLNAVPSLQTSKTSALQKLSSDFDTLLNILNGQASVNQ